MNAFAALFTTVLAGFPTLQEEPPSKLGSVRTVRVKDGETVTVKVQVADAERNILSVVTLPDPVAHVVSAWDRKDLSLEHESNKLFLKLLSKVEGHVDVVTSSGAHYRFLLLPVPAEAPYDSNVIVKTRENAEDDPKEKEKARVRRSASGALELIKAMRLGEVPPLATVRKGNGEVLWTSPNAQVTLLYVYETARFRGYVLGLANHASKEAYHVDVTRFTGERLVLIGSKDVVVPPGKSTRIFVVDWE